MTDGILRSKTMWQGQNSTEAWRLRMMKRWDRKEPIVLQPACCSGPWNCLSFSPYRPCYVLSTALLPLTFASCCMLSLPLVLRFLQLNLCSQAWTAAVIAYLFLDVGKQASLLFPSPGALKPPPHANHKFFFFKKLLLRVTSGSQALIPSGGKGLLCAP